MSARALSAVEPAKGWQPWGALVPFLGIAFVASTVISLTTVLQYAGLVDDVGPYLWNRVSPLRAKRKWRYCPRGVETSVPGGGVNSNIDAGTGPRV